MPALSEWLQLMLAEIARKGDDLERARAEEAQRVAEEKPPAQSSSNVTSMHETRALRR
jgi:hypothetical protein